MTVGFHQRGARVLLPGFLLVACGGGLDDLSSGSSTGGAGTASAGRAGSGGKAGANGGAAGKGTTGGATSQGGTSGGGTFAGTGGSAGLSAGGGGTASGSGGANAGAGGTGGANASGTGGTGGSGGTGASGGSGGNGASAGTANGGGGKGGAAGNAAAGASGSGLGGSATGGAAGAGASGGKSGSGGTSGSGGAPCSGKGDLDCDGVPTDDNCPNLANLDQSDQDADGNGDACDASPGGPDGTTNFGSCGASAGKVAIVLESVTPATVCPGDEIDVTYKAALGSCLISNEIDFRLFVSGSGNDGGAISSGGTFLAEDDELVKTKSITLPKSLTPNDYFLELSAGGVLSTNVRSKRLPLSVGGKGVSASLTVDDEGPLLVEKSPYAATLNVSTPGPYRLLSGSTVLSSGTGPATSTLSLAFPQAGNNTFLVEMTAADGCTVQRPFTFDVLTCNPKLESNTKTSTDPDTTITNLWVCANTSYAGTSRHVYVQPNGTFAGKASSSAVLWLPTGAALGPAMSGTWTILHQGAAPTIPADVKATLVACSTMSFDGSAASQKCTP